MSVRRGEADDEIDAQLDNHEFVLVSRGVRGWWGWVGREAYSTDGDVRQ